MMHILDDSTISTRVARFLTARGERWAPTSVEQIRLSATAKGPDGPLSSVPDDLLEAAIAFEERYGGLAYRSRAGENHMEYGLDGEASFSWTPEYGWSMPAALIDGSWTWPVSLLLDGRTTMDPGEWPDRVIDRTLAQRLEKHALLAEVSAWPHATFTYVTRPQQLPDVDVCDTQLIEEATGPTDRWWYDGQTAVHLTLAGWPKGEDHWVLAVSRTRASSYPRYCIA